MAIRDTLRREFRVAFSRKAQPVWFRLVKWAVIISASVYFWRAPYFWWSIAAVSVLATGVHLIWRAKTNVWTTPWGGWTDVDAARDPASKPTRSLLP